MPPVSEAQRRLMHAAANDPKVAKEAGIKQSVAKEFANADQPGKLPEHKRKPLREIVRDGHERRVRGGQRE